MASNGSSHKMNNIIAALALIATIIGVIIQWPQTQPKVVLTVIRTTNLTAQGLPSGLEGAYLYKGTPVKTVWQVLAKVENLGANTIVGRGEKSQLLTGKLRYAIEGGKKILDVRAEGGAINPIINFDEHQIDLGFDQWRVGEVLQLQVYVEGNDLPSTKPEVASVERSLINGDVIIEDKSSELGGVREVRPEFISQGVWTTLRFVSGLSNLLLLLVVGAILIIGLVEYIRIRMWRGRYREQLREFLSTFIADESKPEHVRRNVGPHFADQPWRMTDLLWAEFVRTGGSKCPSGSPPLYRNGRHALFGSLAFFFIFTGLALSLWLTIRL